MSLFASINNKIKDAVIDSIFHRLYDNNSLLDKWLPSVNASSTKTKIIC
jgi:hypothetical protein